MKRCFAILCVAMTMLMTASAQNPKLNPLNYGGKMYVSAMEVLTTPRYVSYEDHAILSSEMTVPVMEVTVVNFDFEKRIVVLADQQIPFSKAHVKEYSSDYFKTYVIYMNGQIKRGRLNSTSLIEPGCEIVVPMKEKNAAALQNILSIATTSASLATMIASIANILK